MSWSPNHSSWLSWDGFHVNCLLKVISQALDTPVGLLGLLLKPSIVFWLFLVFIFLLLILACVSHPPATELALLPSQALLLEDLTNFFISQGISINSPSCFLISTKFLTCSFPQSCYSTAYAYSMTFFSSLTILLLCLLCHVSHLPMDLISHDLLLSSPSW